MKFFIKQKVFSIGDKFSVYDPNGNERYIVKGKVFSFGKKLSLLDLGENELAFISQKLFSFLPRYEVSKNGQKIAEVQKNFTFFRQEYIVDGPGWKVEGDWFAHEFEIKDGEKTVATLSKEWFSLGDAYAIEISEEADAILALAVVIIIDAVIEDQEND